MTSLYQLDDYLKNFLSSEDFKDYCPNGLQVSGKEEIRKIATAVSAGLDVIEKAAEAKVDALIVHHGIFWNNIDCRIVSSMRKKIKILLENEISLLAFHLPLDANIDCGNNWVAAKEIGLKNLEPFCEYNGSKIGVKGDFDEISAQDFEKKLKDYYKSSSNSVLGGKESVTSAAIVSGGAHTEIGRAIKEGVDCFVTGSFDEFVWHTAHDEKINFFSLGHHATEKVGPQKLGEHLSKKFKLDWQFIDSANPF